ncbi:hypothetical protein K431DRAFT_349672 [Polychaeton citri CBS 116435]|uniref:DUF4045 domain-containing protein n=1 Tax=Polychaeton citri CBS 116435 TaxID=1314669 RepID=A0A9P4ULG3_9PEZI|nr:hypothetical protein K431DRAFT_349672 [Polychaeton citri CBS 116435]
MAEEAPKQQHQHAPTISSTMVRNQDNSDLDPAAFLESISQLKSKREEEDNERLRKLEEEIEKGRKERAARRAGSDLEFANRTISVPAERQRSLSPEKPETGGTDSSPQTTAFSSPKTPFRGNPSTGSTPSSTNTTPRSRALPTHQSDSPYSTMSTAQDEKRASAGVEDVPEFRGFGSVKKKENPVTPKPQPTSIDENPDFTPAASTPPSNATSLARSGTLSWQQRRPTSRPAGGRPMSAASNSTEKGIEPRPTSRESSEPSRDQIAASLGARDPSWFRQTADRGVGSAAYRKSKDEVSAIGEASFSSRRQLPGLSRETSAEPSRDASPAPAESVISSGDNSNFGSTRGSIVAASNRFSANTTISNGSREEADDAKSALLYKASKSTASTDKPSPTNADQPGIGRTLTMSSSQARLAGAAPDRPASPTKGMGGFVQSAMMKRSDSMNKRWSQQQPQGSGASSLSRSNSIVSQRGGYGGLQGSHSMPKLEPTTSDQLSKKEDPPEVKRDDSSTFVKPSIPRHHSRSKSSMSNLGGQNDADQTSPPPSSPSKRWSPTKSSWLESALGKPETVPRPASPTKTSQPDWMANIAKAKAQRQSQDITPKHEASSKNDEISISLRSRSPTKSTPFGPSLLRSSKPSFEASAEVSDRSRPATPLSKPKVTGLGIGGASSKAGPTLAVQAQQLPGSAKKDETPTPPAKPAVLREASVENPALPEQATPSPVPDVKDAGHGESSKSSPQIEEAASSPRVLASKELQKPKPETPPKKDFRSNLRPRGPSEAKSQEEPEFKSMFGALRKTKTENFVAPDTFGDNIRRGKTGLSITGGPQKTVRRDEFRESLVSRKEDIKTKAADPEHKRQASQQSKPDAPAKPEALARRELLGRSKSISSKDAVKPEEKVDDIPEALRRHKTMKSKPDIPKIESKPSLPTAFKPVQKQTEPRPTSPPPATSVARGAQEVPAATSMSSSPPLTSPNETSRLAARFNPGLAGMLARGPPTPSASTPGSRPESPVGRPAISKKFPGSDAPAIVGSDAPLSDMRKGRAKGPKRRKQGDASSAVKSNVEDDIRLNEDKPAPAQQTFEAKPVEVVEKSAKPSIPSRSGIASLVAAAASASRSSPPTPSHSPFLLPKPTDETEMAAPVPLPKPAVKERQVLDFQGFGSSKKVAPAPGIAMQDDDKENSQANSGSPSVKSVSSRWGLQPQTSAFTQKPTQIQLPTKKDEEAAMRSAGLLASSPASVNASGRLSPAIIATGTSPTTSPGLPPKPAKSSRVLIPEFATSSLASKSYAPRLTLTVICLHSKDQSLAAKNSEAGRRLIGMFGKVPTSSPSSSIDAQAILNRELHSSPNVKSSRKSVHEFLSEGDIQSLPPQEEYTFFSESVYICGQFGVSATGGKIAQTFVWMGSKSSASAIEQAQIAAKRLPGSPSGPVHLIKQGKESVDFLNALGGILVTRRSSRTNASKQYMLCGRKHLGRIVFDEVDFAVASLCSGYVFLVSYPLKLQQTRLYLWKGSACSAEELAAARLAAMDLSETGEIIEIDDGVESNSFLSIFGEGAKREILRRKPVEIWKTKVKASGRFRTRLFRVVEAQTSGIGAALVGGLLGGMFARRPSWQGQNQEKARGEIDIKVEAKELKSFSQSDLEAEGIYLLDAYGEVYVLIGPLFASASNRQQGQQQDGIQAAILAQALLFAADYALLAAGLEDRPGVPKGFVVFAGVPEEIKRLFRGWEDSWGLWGTGELMAGWRNGRSAQTGAARAGVSRTNDVDMLGLDEVLGVVYGRIFVSGLPVSYFTRSVRAIRDLLPT